jgi:hypothetical protein
LRREQKDRGGGTAQCPTCCDIREGTLYHIASCAGLLIEIYARNEHSWFDLKIGCLRARHSYNIRLPEFIGKTPR